VGRKGEYRQYSNLASFMLNWGAPGLVALMGIGFLYLSVARPMQDSPPPVFALVLLIGMALFWVRQLRMPRRIILHEDGRLEFVSPVRRVVITVQDITSIKPDGSQLGFLIVRWGAGKLRLLNQFDDFHDLLSRIKQANPGVEIRGC
jgi:hypothetical protein